MQWNACMNNNSFKRSLVHIYSKNIYPYIWIIFFIYFPLGNIHLVCCVNWEAVWYSGYKINLLNKTNILIFKHKVSTCVLTPKSVCKEGFLVLASFSRLLLRNDSK